MNGLNCKTVDSDHHLLFLIAAPAPSSTAGGSSSGGAAASPPKAAAASSPMTATALVAAVAAPLLAYFYLFWGSLLPASHAMPPSRLWLSDYVLWRLIYLCGAASYPVLEIVGDWGGGVLYLADSSCFYGSVYRFWVLTGHGSMGCAIAACQWASGGFAFALLRWPKLYYWTPRWCKRTMRFVIMAKISGRLFSGPVARWVCSNLTNRWKI